MEKDFFFAWLTMRCSPVKETIRELPEVIGAPPPMPEDEKEKETQQG